MAHKFLYLRDQRGTVTLLGEAKCIKSQREGMHTIVAWSGCQSDFKFDITTCDNVVFLDGHTTLIASADPDLASKPPTKTTRERKTNL